MSLDKSDSLDGDSDNDGYDSGSAGTCSFRFCLDNSIGRVENFVACVHGVSSGVFFNRS